MLNKSNSIVYTITDEAPMLATYSLLPVIKAFVSKADISIEISDISLAARVLSAFPDYLKEDQKITNDLEELSKLVNSSNANIIKLPNISASVPQLKSTIKELRSKGFNLPEYPDEPQNELDSQVQARYNKVKGSAVNPVLREGNSDRRAPNSVKQYAKLNPHYMGNWSSDSKTHVATMKNGDFFHNEKSCLIKNDSELKITLDANDGSCTLLKENIMISSDEILDVSIMSKDNLIDFLNKEINCAKNSDILLSVHLKATMMKVSDPIIFSHVLAVFFKDLINKYSSTFNEIGVDFKNGFSDLINRIQNLPKSTREEIEQDINYILSNGPSLAMVDSDKGITNLHVPSDVIIDASMPAMIRNSGKMWDKNGELKDTKAIIPDSSYASVYSAVIDFCKKNGAFNPSTMGTVSNVGLMAQKAEEYGSHDKTFEITKPGTVRVHDQNYNLVFEHKVRKGDIWRMCSTKDNAIKDWVKLAVNRVKATGWPAVFWLDENRAHDAQIIKKVKKYLMDYDLKSLEIKILSPYEACQYTLERVSDGMNTISVTGNVLRDYLTDLFPIIELGTSAKMLSIVPLMNGGGLFETGAGGSAPRHVQQLIAEGHLRWDSLGEFMALVVSLEHFAEVHNNKKAKIFSLALDSAIEKILKNGKSPKRKVGEIDNRVSHFYLAMYWAEELSKQNSDKSLKIIFSNLFQHLHKNKIDIIKELNVSQGFKQNIDGYYFPNKQLLTKVMRPSELFNTIVDNF
ncbi:MAG: isocitrate dehydrogenase (NADP(+)) [Flavobacteriales bacterium]|nr:isocitrate dehydrogenase (NADP(+)) [Flavobacteriales bacterium]